MSLFKENRQSFDALWAQRCLEVDQANERKNELISDMLGGTSVVTAITAAVDSREIALTKIYMESGVAHENASKMAREEVLKMSPAPGDMLGQFGGIDHVVREVVNNLSDTALKYGSTQQLRERLRAAIQPLLDDTAPYTTDSDKYKADLYDEVWAKARAMGYENVTMALHDLTVAKQKAARWDKVLGAVCAEKDRRPEKDTHYFLLSRVVGRVPRGVDPMKGSVAGHFTDHIDNLIKTKPAVS